jgi:pilus assembly protein CpaB
MAAKRYSVFFYVALVVAAIATYGVYRAIESAKAGTRIATKPVVVAARDMTEGEIIDRVALAVAEWPVSTVPAGAYGSVDSVAGRVTRVSVFKGEAFVPGRLAPEGTTAGLATKIQPGRRAMGLRINDVSGISGMIQPNARVDILLTLNSSGEGQRLAKLFMSNMRVLAMGTQVQPGEDGRPIQSTVATLDVSPAEAEKLAVAQTQGSIQLVLRGYGDPDTVKTKGASNYDVSTNLRDVKPEASPPRSRPTPTRQSQPAPAPVVSPPAPVVQKPTETKPESLTVQIYRGGKREDQKFKKDSARDTIRP